MYCRYIFNNPTLLHTTHKLFQVQMLPGKLKLLNMVIRLHPWLLILRLHLTGGN